MSANIFTDTDNRIIVFSDDVNNETMGKLSLELLSFISKDNKDENEKKNFTRSPIHLHINSGGGEVYDMWSLIDIILTSKTPIYTYCTGMAMSAAFLIFIAGHKRMVTPHSTLMYHQVSCYRYGKYQDLVDDREEMDWIQNTIEEYVIKRTGLTKSSLKEFRQKKQDTYFHSVDAIEFGIADQIVM